jgi:hypothetical protein
MKIMRLVIALMVDVFGAACGVLTGLGAATGMFALVFVGEILSFFPDIMGFIFLNPAFGLSGSKKLKSSALQKVGLKKAKKRFIITFILELLPFGILPVWTINELISK